MWFNGYLWTILNIIDKFGRKINKVMFYICRNPQNCHYKSIQLFVAEKVGLCLESPIGMNEIFFKNFYQWNFHPRSFCLQKIVFFFAIYVCSCSVTVTFCVRHHENSFKGCILFWLRSSCLLPVLWQLKIYVFQKLRFCAKAGQFCVMYIEQNYILQIEGLIDNMGREKIICHIASCELFFWCVRVQHSRRWWSAIQILLWLGILVGDYDICMKATVQNSIINLLSSWGLPWFNILKTAAHFEVNGSASVKNFDSLNSKNGFSVQ